MYVMGNGHIGNAAEELQAFHYATCMLSGDCETRKDIELFGKMFYRNFSKVKTPSDLLSITEQRVYAMGANVKDVQSRNIIFADLEKNGYHDSDFFYLYLSTDGIIKSHVHSTTRAGGFIPLENSINKIGCAETMEAVRKAARVQIASAAREMIANPNLGANILVGNTVKVSNKRARKFKGEVFKVTKISYWKSQYGRIETTYAHGAKGIKTNVNNCTVVQFSDDHLSNMANNLLRR